MRRGQRRAASACQATARLFPALPKQQLGEGSYFPLGQALAQAWEKAKKIKAQWRTANNIPEPRGSYE